MENTPDVCHQQTMTAKARMVSSLVPNHRLSQAGAQVKLHAQPNIHPPVYRSGTSAVPIAQAQPHKNSSQQAESRKKADEKLATRA